MDGPAREAFARLAGSLLPIPTCFALWMSAAYVISDIRRGLARKIRTRARQDELASRLMTIPGTRGEILRLGSGLPLSKTLQAARTVSAKFPRWGDAISAAFLSSARPLLSAGRGDTERLPVHGWPECLRRSRRSLSRLLWRTNWRGSPGL